MSGEQHTGNKVPDGKGAAEQPHDLDLNNYIVALFTWITYKISADASSLYKKLFGISISEWRVLAHLGAKGPSTASQISNFQGIDKAAVSRSTAILAARGYILQSNPRGRRIFLTLTPKGVSLYNVILDVALQREEALLQGLSKDERAEVIRLLHRIHQNIPGVVDLGRKLVEQAQE